MRMKLDSAENDNVILQKNMTKSEIKWPIGRWMDVPDPENSN